MRVPKLCDLGGLVARISMLAGGEITLGSAMDRLSAVYGDRPLVSESGSSTSLDYREAASRVARHGGAIAARTVPGDRVVIATPNTYDMFLLSLAASRVGAVPVPLNPQMRPDEIAHVVDDCGAALVIGDVGELEGASVDIDPVAASPDDVAALFYTSGTTGRPKGAALTHRALVGQARSGVAWPGGLHRDEAVFALPIAHIMGFSMLMMMAFMGIPVHLLADFRPDVVLDAIEQRRATVFIGVPTMYRMMEEAGAADRDLSSVRLWGSGADVMPPDLAKKFKSRGATVALPVLGALGEAVFVEGYGLVETAGGVAAKVSLPFLSLGLGDFIGFALPGYKMRVVDQDDHDVTFGEVGELWVKGPGVIRGYWGDEAGSSGQGSSGQGSSDAGSSGPVHDGWLHTGDLVRRGPMGLIGFVGRDKDVIKRGGYSVYATEVQAALEQHPSVLEAAVVGVADERMGEVPVAAVRMDDAAVLEDLDLGAWLEQHIARYKVPTRFLAVDEIPRTATNKVRRERVADLFR